MAFTPPRKEKMTGILAIALYLVTGLLLLFRPDFMAELTRWTVTVALAAAALVKAVRYFRAEPARAAEGYNLTFALIAATFALLAWLNGGMLKNQLWGLLILFGGYMKLQTAWDFYRLNHNRWWWIMIGAAVSLLCGALFLAGVITGNIAVWVGIALLLEAAMDTVVLILTAKGDKWNPPPREKQPREKSAGQEKQADTPPDSERPSEAPAEAAGAAPGTDGTAAAE